MSLAQIKMLIVTICVYMASLRPWSKCQPGKMTKFGFPSSDFYLSHIYNIYLWIYALQSDKSYLIRHKTGAVQ